MQKKQFKSKLSLAVCIVLIAAIALLTTGCNGNTQQEEPAAASTSAQTPAEIKQLGEGATKFTFTVTDTDGAETQFEISTDKSIVGEALQELGLIAGEEGPYGLYVKTVNGITLDYDNDGKYWAFYINGEMAMSGVDTTETEPGTTYSFKAE